MSSPSVKIFNATAAKLIRAHRQRNPKKTAAACILIGVPRQNFSPGCKKNPAPAAFAFSPTVFLLKICAWSRPFQP
jgi:hypothetical protein